MGTPAAAPAPADAGVVPADPPADAATTPAAAPPDTNMTDAGMDAAPGEKGPKQATRDDKAATQAAADAPADATTLPDQAMSPEKGMGAADAAQPAAAPAQGDATTAAGGGAGRNSGTMDEGPTATYVLLADGAQFMSTPPSDDGSPPTTWLFLSERDGHCRVHVQQHSQALAYFPIRSAGLC
eukprot:jgi/Botrbrau1/1277/Bobra.0163s0060.1